MSNIATIDDQVITTDSFIRLLKLNGTFDGLVTDLVRDKVAALAAQREGVEIDDDELQQRADDYRRALGLHRAKDTMEYFNKLGVSVDDFEQYIRESLLKEKVLEKVANDEAVEEYFRLNSPRFDSIELSHIAVESEGAARELMSLLEESPESFETLAAENSVAETAEQGGKLGKVLRGHLSGEIESKLFNAKVGDVVGPFESGDGGQFHIYRVDAIHSASLDDDTRAEIRRGLKEMWLDEKAKECQITID